jgi:hypothetical protein
VEGKNLGHEAELGIVLNRAFARLLPEDTLHEPIEHPGLSAMESTKKIPLFDINLTREI